MQSSALEDELRTVQYDTAQHIRDLESWIVRYATSTARDNVWDRLQLRSRRERSLFTLFKARWASENARADAESLTAYLERLRAAYAAAISEKTKEERAALKTALLQWEQSYEDLVAST